MSVPYADPEQQRRYQREWMARRRAEWLADKACVDCGGTESLEIDHRDPAKKVSHRLWSWSRPRREVELAKCEVRCERHHRERHAQETMRHGRKRYEAGCRCKVCRAAKAKANRRYRSKRR